MRCLLALLLLARLAAVELTVLTENYPQFNYESAKGEVVGICTRLVRELQKRTGDTAPIQLQNWSQAYQTCLKQPNTALFSTKRTDEREALFRWVGPLISHSTWLYAKADSGIAIERLEDLKVYRIGTYKDDAMDAWLRKKGLADQLETATDNRINATKLKADHIQLWAAGGQMVPIICRQAGINPKAFKPVFKIYDSQLYLAFNTGTDPALVARWQKALASMKADGSYQKIVDAPEAAP